MNNTVLHFKQHRTTFLPLGKIQMEHMNFQMKLH